MIYVAAEARGSSNRGAGPVWSGAGLTVSQTARLRPQRRPKSAGVGVLTWGVGRTCGSLILPGAVGYGGHVSSMSWGCCWGWLGSSPPSCQAAAQKCQGFKEVLLCSPLRLSPGEEVLLALGPCFVNI